VVWLLAAFDLLRLEPGSGFDVNLTKFQTWAWLSTAGLLGVLLAVPLRKHFIDDENLPYPDGMAAGETLIALDADGPQARRSAAAMMGALVSSGLVFFATTMQWIRDAIPLLLNDFSARVGMGFGVSLLSIGSGMIIGLRISASMLIGGIVAWVLMPPWLVEQGLLAADGRRVDVLLLVMWPSVGLLVAGGICALLLRWRVLAATFRSLAAADVTSGDLPLRWVLIGSGVSALLLIALQAVFFATPVWHSVIAIVLAIPLGLVALRVLGETNWGPISTMTNVMQAMFGVIAPGDLRANMVSSGITATVASESEALMQDFRAGQMIGSTPRVLTYMQLIAVPIGALALAFAYPLLRDTYGIVGDNAQLLSPTSQRWVGFAKLVTQDLSGDNLTPAAAARLSWMQMSTAVGAVIGILLTLLEQKKSWRPFVPSPAGVGIAMVIPVNAVTVIFIGAVIDQIWRRVSPGTQTHYAIPSASGLIAGEAIVAVLIPILVTIGLMSLP
jgi:putative OPT family oligopeptide transporter